MRPSSAWHWKLLQQRWKAASKLRSVLALVPSRRLNCSLLPPAGMTCALGSLGTGGSCISQFVTHSLDSSLGSPPWREFCPLWSPCKLTGDTKLQMTPSVCRCNVCNRVTQLMGFMQHVTG